MAHSLLLLVLLAATAYLSRGDDTPRSDDFHRKHVRFHFFNKENAHLPKGYQIQGSLAKQDILDAGYNPDYPTKVITPGLKSAVTSKDVQILKDAYFGVGSEKVNMIVVDWSDLSFIGFGNLHAVGSRAAEVLDFMVQQGLLGLNQLHIIGPSMGAHLAGVTGEHLTSGRAGRISGLDPTRLFINLTVRKGRLSNDDADLVDVIHTNAGILSVQPALGHVDFYPNGGKKQPGCGADFFGLCSHPRAVLLWAESVANPTAFSAWRCADEWDALHQRCQASDVLANMGEHLSFSEPGSYFLETKDASPFSLV